MKPQFLTESCRPKFFHLLWGLAPAWKSQASRFSYSTWLVTWKRPSETNLPVQMQDNILYSVRGMCVFFLRYLQDFNGMHAQCPYCLQAATVLSIVLIHYFFVKNSPDCTVNGCVRLTVQPHRVAPSNRPHASWGKLQKLTVHIAVFSVATPSCLVNEYQLFERLCSL